MIRPPIRLGLPSKGRLMEDTFAWLAARGLHVTRDGARGYAATCDWPGVEPVLLSASEVPGELAAGRLHLGVTGADLIAEGGVAAEPVAAMGFGQADVVVAVPDFWADVATLDDLDAACAQFRRAHGHRLRVATKYHRLARTRFAEAGIADYVLVDSQGATEGAVRAEAAEAIVDITSTGETLRANGLRVLADGVILRSEATLWRSRAADWQDADRALLMRLEGRM